MPGTNRKSYNILDAMKPDQKIEKLEDGNDSLDNFIRQAVGKEPVLSYPRAVDSPVQWIQLLQALDYQDLPGWPLLAPPKVQMQKCEKCAREFCSSINYRRHIRAHRRALNIDKDFSKNRDFLGSFWDKEVPGSSIVKTLTSVVRKPGFSSLPPVYVNAGSALLDVVQSKAARFPISSEELFSVLDDASEKTFLCAGTALSLQKFVFDGEPGKIGLEMKNVVACTCFLVEQKLIKAWIADKDAEALRCQNLLMDEEEAAHKRQAELLERRRLRKLRQELQKRAKEHVDLEEADLPETSSDSLTSSPSEETFSPPEASNFHSYPLEEPSDLEPLGGHTNELDASGFPGLADVQFDTTVGNVDSNHFWNVDHRVKKVNARGLQRVARRPSSSYHHDALNNLHSNVIHPKSGPVQRQGVHRDQKSSTFTNVHKIWTRKTKPDSEREELNVVVLPESRDSNAQVLQDLRDQPDQNEKFEVLIGSISVRISESNGHCQDDTLSSHVDHCAPADNPLPQNKNVQEKHAKSDSGQYGTNLSVKLWRPVGNKENPSSATVMDGERETDVVSVVNTMICSPSLLTLIEEDAGPSGLKLFCSTSAKAFLTQRWKEAIATEHVRLVLSPENVPANEPDDAGVALDPNILCSSENRLSNVGSLDPAIHGAPIIKSKAKPRKNSKLKYIAKQRNST